MNSGLRKLEQSYEIPKHYNEEELGLYQYIFEDVNAFSFDQVKYATARAFFLKVSRR